MDFAKPVVGARQVDRIDSEEPQSNGARPEAPTAPGDLSVVRYRPLSKPERVARKRHRPLETRATPAPPTTVERQPRDIRGLISGSSESQMRSKTRSAAMPNIDEYVGRPRTHGAAAGLGGTSAQRLRRRYFPYTLKTLPVIIATKPILNSLSDPPPEAACHAIIKPPHSRHAQAKVRMRSVDFMPTILPDGKRVSCPQLALALDIN